MSTSGSSRPASAPGWLAVVHALSSVSSMLYATLLVAAYVAVIAAWVVRFPDRDHQVQGRQFLVYLLLMSIGFLLYILCYLTRRNTQDIRTWPNDRSHGSAFLRQGSIVFGLGTLVYALLEFTSFFQVIPGSPCYDVLDPIVSFLFAIFTILQVITIVGYPRLNISAFPVMAKFGLMHLVTTNAIVWIHTTVEESIHELVEAEESELELLESKKIGGFGGKEAFPGESDSTMHGEAINGSDCSIAYLKKLVEGHHGHCRDDKYFNNFMGDTLETMSPFLFAFIIEFSLIGATVFLETWSHVSPPPPHVVEKNRASLRLHSPKPRDYISKIDCSHSLSGLLLGLFVAIINFVNLGVFFYMASTEDNGDEFVSKVTNIVLNVLGIGACVMGLIRIQSLEDKEEKEDNGLDLSLLNISGFFMFFYASLTMIVGFHANSFQDYPDYNHPTEIIIINGMVEIFYVTLQITFLVNLLQKSCKSLECCPSECHPAYDGCKPGRQAVMFLIVLNISQWIIATFELQKSLSSPWEKAYYGFLPWVILQRMSLPLCVFFRFHSAVIAIDCWKNSYKTE